MLQRIGLNFLLLATCLFGQERIAMSGVKGLPVHSVDVLSSLGKFEISGPDAAVFSFEKTDKGGVLKFDATKGKRAYFAELKAGEHKTLLAGLASDALEGHNEHPLQTIFQVLGVKLDAGGKQLSLNTEKDVIGDSVLATEFEPVKGSPVRFVGLARYSPKGVVPFGFILSDGSLQQVGALADVSKERPDSHQCLMPPTLPTPEGVIVKNPPARFGIFLKGPHYTSLTQPGASKGAKIKHTVRVYPVEEILGRQVKDAFLICFEEAKNGDYQDAVFLIEGVQVAK